MGRLSHITTCAFSTYRITVSVLIDRPRFISIGMLAPELIKSWVDPTCTEYPLMCSTMFVPKFASATKCF